ncbi:hypothetical protein E1301_Tti005300 [Triplophysa tibetana]|uniref:Uncharacterized protein n=1 Tax=Triplophysa tibetana TaxID=1572043 RepID=A0A5A9PPW5_9TELE|nr:hypothetical protein E1301_Tti005300 [Triplophysa tibetana]
MRATMKLQLMGWKGCNVKLGLRLQSAHAIFVQEFILLDNWNALSSCTTEELVLFGSASSLWVQEFILLDNWNALSSWWCLHKVAFETVT